MASTSDGRRVPRAVSIIAAFQALGGILSIVVGLMVSGDQPALAVFGVVLGVLLLVVAVKLRDGAPWARTATIVLQSLAFGTAVWRLAHGTVDTSLVIAPAIVYTLLRNREVLAYFGVGRPTPAAL